MNYWGYLDNDKCSAGLFLSLIGHKQSLCSASFWASNFFFVLLGLMALALTRGDPTLPDDAVKSLKKVRANKKEMEVAARIYSPRGML